MPDKSITVTSPLLPSLDDFIPMLKDIWDRKWLTNNGHYHKELEKALAEYLGVEYISLFTNGTLPLITALQAMRITGEVITTPYSFVATTMGFFSDDTDDINVNHVVEITLGYVFGVIIVGVAKVIIDALSD